MGGLLQETGWDASSVRNGPVAALARFPSALVVAIWSAAIPSPLWRVSLLPCLVVTLFECGDSSPLLLVSRFPEGRGAERETTDSGEASPQSKRVTTKQHRKPERRRNRRTPKELKQSTLLSRTPPRGMVSDA